MSEHSPESLGAYGKRCLIVFAAVMCLTLTMVGIFYAHLPVRMAIALTLVGACANASLVAGFLMHLVSERKMIFIVLAFTAIFFVALMLLTVSAHHSVPLGTVN